MAELLAKNELKTVTVSRGQEVAGEVVAILPHEIILDLGSKSEGVLQKKDLSPEQVANLKMGDKLLTFVIQPENENGQVVLGLQKSLSKSSSLSSRWKKFEEALKNNTTLTGKGLEVNKGGLIVEVAGVRGFLPSSQVSLAQATNLDELVGKNVNVTVIEVDVNQNRLIFSQKTNLSEETKKQLGKLKIGDSVKGIVAAVLPFGIFATLEDNVEGLVHISEISWEKVEDPAVLFKVGDSVEAKIISLDANTGRVNLSMKQLQSDPFVEKTKNLQPDDIVKGVVSKVTTSGVFVEVEDPAGDGNNLNLEGLIPASKLESETEYQVGKSITCLVNSVDTQKRRINLTPFITTTKGLIYK
ncbi:30S ribosomal protein S1 [Candidatus Daviesbacteria bacterium]|nr:30S ribosomal protein S1 [Candidatus Daviesbacteria bacterium]